MTKNLVPGCIGERVVFKNNVLKRLEADDAILIHALLAKLPSKTRHLFEADPHILYTLLEAGSCNRRYKEPRGEARELFPSISVLRSRLRTVQKKWFGLIRIHVRKERRSSTIRVRFTATTATRT